MGTGRSTPLPTITIDFRYTTGNEQSENVRRSHDLHAVSEPVHTPPMTEHDRPQTAEEFLRVWYVLAEADNTVQLQQLEEQFPELAKSQPDVALEIVRNLGASNSPGAKEAATINARYVFHTHRKQITDLLVALFENGDPELKGRILDTIEFITSDKNRLSPTQAADLIAAMKSK